MYQGAAIDTSRSCLFLLPTTCLTPMGGTGAGDYQNGRWWNAGMRVKLPLSESFPTSKRPVSALYV